MKIFMDDKVYVSVHDIQFLRRNRITIPLSVLIECIEYLNKTNYNKDNVYHEFIMLDSPDAIDFFAKQRQIIDYDKFKHYTTKSLRNLILKVYITAKELERDYKSLEADVNSDKGKVAILQQDSEYFNHVAYSLQEIIRYRNKEVTLPTSDKNIIYKEFLTEMFNNGMNGAMHEKIYRR